MSAPVPIYEMDADAQVRRPAWLHPVAATRFHVESLCEDIDSATYDDWPWFLHSLRPGGFMGRRIAVLHPSLHLPEDPRLWSSDQLLRYLNHHGGSGSGALLLGEPALSQGLHQTALMRCDEDPREEYPRLVDDLNAAAPAGSSAEGEQPKFLVARSSSHPERLVKFSPPLSSVEGRRVADLLLTEHHALSTLALSGVPAARSSVIEAKSRVFLETERFDRTPVGGRIGLLSLEAFDRQFIGDGGRSRWPSIAARLLREQLIPAESRELVARLHAFGHLIGNTDMHTGNLSFLMRGQRVLGVAPAYDMAPMLFAPLRGELPRRELTLALGAEVPRSIWQWAIDAAQRCWLSVSADERVSPAFRRIALDSAARVDRARTLASRLPE